MNIFQIMSYLIQSMVFIKSSLSDYDHRRTLSFLAGKLSGAKASGSGDSDWNSVTLKKIPREYEDF